MEKEKADSIITEYMKKIYGFALSKTRDIDQAEELASRIIMKVYHGLLKTDNVQNIVSYIYRISCNEHSQFVIDEIANKQIIKEKSKEITNPQHDKEKVLHKIRSEIAYLSKIQREVTIMHYYQNLKLKEIAEKLNLSETNVKKILFDARNHIKSGFNIDKNVINPQNQVFSKLTGRGRLGPQMIDISFYFSKSIIQRIAYSTYHKPKTTVEIARELATPAVFIEDELSFLIEYGFMNKVGESKYQTNMHITALDKDAQENMEMIYKEYAKHYCEIYIPLLMQTVHSQLSTFNSSLSTAIYIPENDLNFFLWTIVAYSCGVAVVNIENEDELYKFYTKRKDGSNYVAHAYIQDEASTNPRSPIHKKTKKEKEDGTLTGEIFTSGTKSSLAWTYCSKYDDREVELFLSESKWLFSTLYDFMTGKLKKDDTQINKFVRLFERGFIVPSPPIPFASSSDCPKPKETSHAQAPASDLVNLIVTTMNRDDFHSLFPPIPHKLKKIGKNLEIEQYKILKKHHPPNMQELTKLDCQNSYLTIDTTMHILEYLLKTGALKPLKKHQKKTVNMILFSDVLPFRN